MLSLTRLFEICCAGARTFSQTYLLKWELIFWLQKAVGASDSYTKIQQFEATDALVNAIVRDLLRWRPHAFINLRVEMGIHFLASERGVSKWFLYKNRTV